MSLSSLRFALVLVFPWSLGAATPTPPAPASEDSNYMPMPPIKAASGDSAWVFSILPKSLQKNPRLEITVLTEMTEAGKKQRPVTPDRPAYYQAFSGGLRQMGDSPSNRTMTPEEVEKVLSRSLASNGFLPAKLPEHPPTLLIIYTWGAHTRLEEGSPEQNWRNTIERAALVGGEKFAVKIAELMEREGDLQMAAGGPVPPGGEPVITPEMVAFISPIAMFRRESFKNEFLTDQTGGDVYYVVASAYDFASAATNRRILLWRTRMTVASSGVAQDQTMPTLILSAAPYFGRDMPEPDIVNRRTVREGSVELGTPTVVPDKKQ